MGTAMRDNLLIGVLGAVVIDLMTLVPNITRTFWFGPLHWLIWIAFWIWLGSHMVSEGRAELAQGGSPAMGGMLWGGLVGVLSGLVGAIGVVVLTIIEINRLAGTTDAVFRTSVIMTTVMLTGLTLPTLGAFWSGVAGLVFGGRLSRAAYPNG